MRFTRPMLEAELQVAKARIAELEAELADAQGWCRELMRAAEAANAADDGLISNLTDQVLGLQDEVQASERDLQIAFNEIDSQDQHISRLRGALLRHATPTPQ